MKPMSHTNTSRNKHFTQHSKLRTQIKVTQCFLSTSTTHKACQNKDHIKHTNQKKIKQNRNGTRSINKPMTCIYQHLQKTLTYICKKRKQNSYTHTCEKRKSLIKRSTTKSKECIQKPIDIRNTYHTLIHTN